LPLQHAQYSFLIVLAIITACIAATVLYFKKRDWL
jgi:Mg2+ and Co2+ transporter CorA